MLFFKFKYDSPLFFSFKKSKTNFVVADSSLKSSEASPGGEKRKVSVGGIVNHLGDYVDFTNSYCVINEHCN